MLYFTLQFISYPWGAFLLGTCPRLGWPWVIKQFINIDREGLVEIRKSNWKLPQMGSNFEQNYSEENKAELWVRRGRCPSHNNIASFLQETYSKLMHKIGGCLRIQFIFKIGMICIDSCQTIFPVNIENKIKENRSRTSTSHFHLQRKKWRKRGTEEEWLDLNISMYKLYLNYSGSFMPLSVEESFPNWEATDIGLYNDSSQRQFQECTPW